MTLEQFLKQRRVELGITQAQMAKHFGHSSPQYCSNYERGKCTLAPAQFRLVSRVLKVPLEDLIEMRGEDVKASLRKKLKVRA